MLMCQSQISFASSEWLLFGVVSDLLRVLIGAGIAFTTASQSVDEDDGIISVCAVIVFDADSTLLEDEVNVTLRFMEGSATGKEILRID